MVCSQPLRGCVRDRGHGDRGLRNRDSHDRVGRVNRGSREPRDYPDEPGGSK